MIRINKMIRSRPSIEISFFLSIIFLILVTSRGATASMTDKVFELPENIGAWTRLDSVQIIDSTNIFDYMNGAGELYLGYRLKHLEVFEYKAENQPDIIVEIYRMETSDDAFGLLSLDWSGETIHYDQSAETKADNNIAPSIRALYGMGLLRQWSGNNYCRILAARETSKSRDAVIALGGTINAKSEISDQPKLLQVLPKIVNPDWILKSNRVGYFRSYLTLNSFFYISHKNILNLDHTTEALSTQFEKITDTDESERVQVLFIKYAENKLASKALKKFYQAYLPEHLGKFTVESKINDTNFFELEDGWLGYKLHNECIVIVFTCPDQETTRKIIDSVQFNKKNGE